jgi:mono/diheme cytochrome c family protein
MPKTTRKSHLSKGPLFAGALFLTLPLVAVAQDGEALIGDIENGAKLFENRCGTCHGARSETKKGGSLYDSTRLGGWKDKQLVGLMQGQRTKKKRHPAIKPELSLLQSWDVAAYLRSRTTDLSPMKGEANWVFRGKGEMDEFAVERVEKALGRKLADDENKSRVFAFYKIGKKEGLRLVPNNARARERLKPKKMRGFAVFQPLKGFKNGDHEVGIAVNKDIQITHVVIRAPDGTFPEDLNRDAGRFVGKGGRAFRETLRAAGAGRHVRSLTKPLTDAFIIGMEAVYMYEKEERDRFSL